MFSNWSSVYTVLVTKIRDRKQWNSLVVWRIWFVSSQLQHVHVSWEGMDPVKIVSLARKIPSAPPPQFVHPKQLWIWVCERKSGLFLPRSSAGNVITGYYSPETRRKPQQSIVASLFLGMSALLWVGTWSFLESPQKLFPTLISKRLLGDFLWSGKLYRYIHRTSSNNFGVVRVNGSNIRNYMVRLRMCPFLVICRSSLFSLQIKKEFLKTRQLSLLYLRYLSHGGGDTQAAQPPPGWLTEPSWQQSRQGSGSDPALLSTSGTRSERLCLHSKTGLGYTYLLKQRHAS